MWESNPHTRVLTGLHGFEDRMYGKSVLRLGTAESSIPLHNALPAIKAIGRNGALRLDADGLRHNRGTARSGTEPELAPVNQRVELSGALMDVDLNLLSDHAISRIADGEHPVKVLIGAVLGGEEDPGAVEHLREDILPRLLGAGDDEAED